MENATKALIMAGGVLISVLLISFLLILLRKGGAANAEYQTTMSDTELAKFNSQFEVYDRKNNTYFDVITVANMAYDINKKNGYDSQNSVSVYLCVNDKDNIIYSILPNNKAKKNYFFIKKNTNQTKDMYSLVSDFAMQEYDYDTFGNIKEVKYKYKYGCLSIDYNNTTGKVNSIKFLKENN